MNKVIENVMINVARALVRLIAMAVILIMVMSYITNMTGFRANPMVNYSGRFWTVAAQR